MKKYLLVLLGAFSFSIVKAKEGIRWMQQPAISPDGRWIAFEFKGNIYKVSAEGGQAVMLTSNGFYNGYPIWSHDGRSIAFASDRYGNFDVFLMSSLGGPSKRLTNNSSRDIPTDFSPDDRLVYFGSARHDISSSVRFPNDNLWVKLLSVPVSGGQSRMISGAGMEYAHCDRSGKVFIYQDRKGTESALRKHHVSPVTRDIWKYDAEGKTYQRLSMFEGEDREPVWGEGDDFYYLSERNGSQNLFRSKLSSPNQANQLTNFTLDPVRNLSRSHTGVLSFTQNGDLYTLQGKEEPHKITVLLSADVADNLARNITLDDQITELALSPNGKEVAFVCHGEVFTAARDGSRARNITNTPYEEKMVSFSPDGKKLVFSAETEGSWQIIESSFADPRENCFYLAGAVQNKQLIATSADEFQPIYSPDGKLIAYWENRNTLKLFDLHSKTSTTIWNGSHNYSYMDGDQPFSWSPDSRYLLIASGDGFSGQKNMILLDPWNNEKALTLLPSGFSQDAPKWSADGKMIYYRTNELGMQNMSNGGQEDIYAIFPSAKLYNYFQSDEEQQKTDQQVLHYDTTGAPGKLDPVDFSTVRDREMRLTSTSMSIVDEVASSGGDKLYYLGRAGNEMQLYVTDIRKQDTKVLTSSVEGYHLDLSPDGKTIYILGSKISKVNAGDGRLSVISPITRMVSKEAEERAYILDHVYQVERQKFWDTKMNGADWTRYYQNYKQFLPFINNNYDFEILLSELLGELNSSHTGAGYRPKQTNGDRTATLGLLYDQAYDGVGLKVAAIIPEGPFDRIGTQLCKGAIIDRIDGILLDGQTDVDMILNQKADVYTSIEFHIGSNKKPIIETIRPITLETESQLLYNRWVRRMENLTDSLSNGRLGYFHIRAMDEAGIRKAYDGINDAGRRKEAMIIDTRFNTGGNIGLELVKMLQERSVLTGRPQGAVQNLSTRPDGTVKPSCLLVSEGNYSDAFNFAYLYKRLQLGKVVGTPVAGTGTGVLWEPQIDRTLVVGIPQWGLSWVNEKELLENHTLIPDITVYNTYSKMSTGSDEQLQAAVKELLKQLDNSSQK